MKKDSALKSVLVGRYGSLIWGVISLYLMSKGVEVGDDEKETIMMVIENGEVFITGAISVILATISKLREAKK